MKNHKLIKLGILTSSALVLGLGQPVLQTVLPGFDGGVVKAEEDDTRRPLKVFAYGYEGDKRVELIPESVEYVTPNSPYTVAHPKVDGWKPTVTVLGTFDGTISRVESGSKLTYDDLYYEGGAGGGGINYVYERVSESEGETISKPEETGKVAEDNQEERSIAIQYVEINSDGSTHSIAPEGNFPIDAFLTPSNSYTVSHPTIDGYTPSGATLFTNGVETTLEDGKELNYNDIGAQRAMYNGVLTYKYTAVSNAAPEIPVQPAESGQPNPEENQQPKKFRVHYWDDSFGSDGLPTYTPIQAPKEIYLQPGQSVTEIAPDIPGYTLATNIEGNLPSYLLDYDNKYGDTRIIDDDGAVRIGFFYTKIDTEKPNEIQPEKPVENSPRHLYIDYIISGGLDRPDGLTSSTGIIHSTVLLKPGESYTFPNVTAPGYQLLGVYNGDKELGVGGKISYEDISYNKDSDFYASTVYYIYGRTPNSVSKEIPAGAVKYRILNYDDTMDGTVPTYTEVAPAQEGYVLPGETLVVKPMDIPGYSLTKKLPWGAEQAHSITITTKSLAGAVSGIIQNSFFYTKNPESTPTPTTPVQPQVETRRIHVVYQDITKLYTFGDGKDIELSPGQSYTVVMPEIDGYKADSFDFADSHFWTYAALKKREEHYTRGLTALTLNYDDIAPVTEEGRVHNPILYMQYRPVNTETDKPTTPVKPTQPEIPEEKPSTPVQQAGRTILINSYGVDGEKITSFVNNDEAYITPESPYIVNQPEIDGWERGDIILVNHDGSEKKVTNGSLITYESLYHEGHSIYDGGLKYTYKRSTKQQPQEELNQPTSPVKPVDKLTKPAEPNKPVNKSEVKPTNQAGNDTVTKTAEKRKVSEQKQQQTHAVMSDKKIEKAKVANHNSDAKSLPNTGETQSSLGILGFILALFGLAGWIYKGRHERGR